MTQDYSRRRTIKLSGGAMITAGLLSGVSACGAGPQSSKHKFDYVIVGAGSAGCVMAARLTENPNTRVLLLEAGPSSADPLIDDPKNWFRLTFGDHVWKDSGTPQKYANHKALQPIHGKLVGGSSAINAMIHHRPTPEDIDEWNVPGWRWQDLAPLFSQSEHFLDGPSALRGNAGPIKVMTLPDPPPLADVTLAAAERLGYGTSTDINGEVQLGACLNQIAFDGRKRQHTGYAYLERALERENLVVVTQAHATALAFDGNRCTGLTYQRAKAMQSVEAGSVILSAGALRTPALLMRSGIGPADHLRDIGIDIRIDAKNVGQNLHDHILVAGHNFATQNKVDDSKFHGSVANVYAASEHSNGARDLMLNVSTTPAVLPPLNTPEHGFKTTFSFTKPKSRGTLHLASSDPFMQPIIDHNIFSHPTDMEGSIAALSLSRDILGSSEFGVLSGTEQNQTFLKDRKGMRELLIAGATLYGHHSGTCRMGTDSASVIDEKLRVRGAKGLIVIDASVIPSIPSCPTNALVIAIAELAAKRI